MDNNIFNYTTKGNQRWCDVSQACYGSPFQIATIINMNPDMPINAVIQDGTILKIPILATIDVPTINELLPPWKQH